MCYYLNTIFYFINVFILFIKTMKKVSFIVVALMGMLVAGCNQSDEQFENANAGPIAPVRVHVDGFSVSHEDFSGTQTRATKDVAAYSGVNAVTLAFYSGSTEKYKATQLKTDASTYTTFGSFSLSLPMGSYTMVVLAYNNSDASPLTLTSPTVAAYTGTRAYETFAYTQAVNITGNSAVDISAVLDRIVSSLNVISTDGKTADVTNVRMTFSAGGKDFNPTTGFAITNTGFANTVGNSAAVGSTSTSLSYLFLASDEQTMNVTIETLDADGAVLFSKTVNNVPFKRNRITKLTGAMYTNTSTSGVFQVETGWLTDENMNF